MIAVMGWWGVVIGCGVVGLFRLGGGLLGTEVGVGMVVVDVSLAAGA